MRARSGPFIGCRKKEVNGRPSKSSSVAKASLYKHFESKEALAARVMIALRDRALADLSGLAPELTLYVKLESMLPWALEVRLAGRLPLLPSGSVALRDRLLANGQYVPRIQRLNQAMTP